MSDNPYDGIQVGNSRVLRTIGKSGCVEIVAPDINGGARTLTVSRVDVIPLLEAIAKCAGVVLTIREVKT